MKSRVLLTPVLVAGLAALPAAAQEKQKPPQGGAAKPFVLPASQHSTLKNGMRVTITPYGAIPKAAIQIVIRAGNIDEGPNQIWLADFMGDLMKEGTATRTSSQIAEEAAGMGGSVNVSVGPDETTVSADVLSDNAADMVKLLADVVQHPLLPASELERIRANRIRGLAISLSTPGALASEAFDKAMFGDHPYGRIFPTEEMLKSYTIEDVRNFYKVNIGAQRAHVYIAGVFDPSISKVVATAFESWAAGPAAKPNIPKTAAKKSFVLIDRPGAAQSTIRFGLPVPPASSPDYLPMEVTDALLGGSFASRITSNIREQKGYTYSPGSTVFTYNKTAIWSESADITTAVTGAALTEIVNEIVRLRKDPPSAEELQGIKNYLAGLFVIRNSSRQGVIGQMRFVDLQGLPADWLRNYVPNVLKVSPSDVQRVAETYLNPDKMALVVVGDKAKVAEQVKGFEPAK
jgi:predicted Zn-dependent peptidase